LAIADFYLKNSGAVGHLGSAATVAASSFDMTITDPRPFLDAIDQTRLKVILGSQPTNTPKTSPVYVEPCQRSSAAASNPNEKPQKLATESAPPISSSGTPDIRQGKVQCLGDFIDTDAVSGNGWHCEVNQMR
jgi:hypothetical protein